MSQNLGFHYTLTVAVKRLELEGRVPVLAGGSQ